MISIKEAEALAKRLYFNQVPTIIGDPYFEYRYYIEAEKDIIKQWQKAGLVVSSKPEPTTCPTCGTPVKVVGNVTKHYEPIKEPKQEEPKEERSCLTCDYNGIVGDCRMNLKDRCGEKLSYRLWRLKGE
jgi:hypothetical protein